MSFSERRQIYGRTSSLLCEMQDKTGNEKSSPDHHEKWKARDAGGMCHLRNQAEFDPSYSKKGLAGLSSKQMQNQKISSARDFLVLLLAISKALD